MMLIHSFSGNCLRGEVHCQDIEVGVDHPSMVSRLFQERNDVQLDLHRKLLKQRKLLESC